MRLSSSLVVLAAALAIAPATKSFAADYDPPILVDQAPEYQPVEVGNGWYLRGDVGYTFKNPYRNDDFAATPGLSFSEDHNPVSGSIGMGYHFSDYFRGELNFGRLATGDSSLEFSTLGGAGALVSNTEASTDNELWTGMVNAYADLGTIAGITPFIGAGIGVVYNKRSYNYAENFVDPTTTDMRFEDAERHYDWAYSLGAGINYAVTRNLSVDVGYEYFNSPGAEYAEITGPATYDIKKGLEFHKVKVGLRYDLW